MHKTILVATFLGIKAIPLDVGDDGFSAYEDLNLDFRVIVDIHKNTTYCSLPTTKCDKCPAFNHIRHHAPYVNATIPTARSLPADFRSFDEERLTDEDYEDMEDEVFWDPMSRSTSAYENEGCVFPKIEDDLGPPGDTNHEWTETFTDCEGNPLPAGIKFYRPDPHFERVDAATDPAKNAYIKHNSHFHFVENTSVELMEAHEYCNNLNHGLGIKATMLWCPGSADENNWIWVHHPDQPFKGTYKRTKGLWTGVFRKFSNQKSSPYLCGQNHTYFWYQQEYFKWRGVGTSNPEPHIVNWKGTHFEDSVLVRNVGPNWEDWCHSDPTGFTNPQHPHGTIVCEMNCDYLNVSPFHTYDPDLCSPPCEHLCVDGQCVCGREDCNHKVTPEGGCKSTMEDEVDIDVDDGPIDILDELPDDIEDEEIQELQMHGCHCPKLGRLSEFIEVYGGSGRIDDIDQQCKLWFDARRCVGLEGPGGVCHDTPGYKSMRYKLLIDKNSGDMSCYLNSDPCLYAICTIDVKYTLNILYQISDLRKLTKEQFKAVLGDGVICPTCQSTGMECIPALYCEGYAPDVRLVKA